MAMSFSSTWLSRREFPELESDFMSPDIDEKVWGQSSKSCRNTNDLKTREAIRATRPEDMCLAIARAKAGIDWNRIE